MVPKIILIISVIVLIGILTFLGYKKVILNNQPNPSTELNINPSEPIIKPKTTLSPIFSYLSTWVSDAVWDTPQESITETPYGKLSAMKSEGKIMGESASKIRNFEDAKIMKDLGYIEDIKFAADGPGASNWGYSKTENGFTQVVIFSYSTNRLLGPESKEPPFVDLSVFVSNPER